MSLLNVEREDVHVIGKGREVVGVVGPIRVDR